MANNHICIANAIYNENCKDNIQCTKYLGPGGTCQNGKCMCSEKYTPFPALNVTSNDNYKIKCYPFVGELKSLLLLNLGSLNK